MKKIKFIMNFLAIGTFLMIASCSDDVENEIAPPPTTEDAVFSYSFDAENPNKVFLTADPVVPTWYTHWDLGDNSSAEGLEASKVYLKKGDYDVVFKVFTTGGEASSVQTIVINEDFEGPNILLNGEFEGDASWTVLPISDGVDVSFTDGKAVWSGGNLGQVAIYQAVHIEANIPYQIDMDIVGSGMSDSWYEVYIGMQVPISGADYSDGGIRLGLSTWNGCGAEPFEGLLTEVSCVGEGGGLVQFTTTGTAYLVVRGGGADYGSAGVSIDNASIRPLESGIVITPPVFPPVANFSIEKSGFTATFTNTTSNGSSYVWDFGDNIGTSTDENPTYTYTAEGTYTVKLIATNIDGTDESIKDLTIGTSLNLITNGTFSDDSGWTIINMYDTDNGFGSVTIADGVAKFTETESPSEWKHWALYTEVVLEPGTYQFDMEMTYSNINEIWGEVYIGATKPIENMGDYNGDQQVLKAFNAWNCGNIKTYSGSAVAGGCHATSDNPENPGQIEITSAGTYYLLFRSGGGQYGTEGITIDNMSLIKQ
tara:strand:- start:6066 stop:7682 length:1617 start_codon:yes stop_codon:yes gene_type:complete